MLRQRDHGADSPYDYLPLLLRLVSNLAISLKIFAFLRMQRLAHKWKSPRLISEGASIQCLSGAQELLCPGGNLPSGENVVRIRLLWILTRPLVLDEFHSSFKEDFVCWWVEVEP